MIKEIPSTNTVYMGFILGLVLLILGIAIIPITEEQTRYRTVYGFTVPYTVTIHPYQEIGMGIALIGIIFIGSSIYVKTIKREKHD